MASTQPLTSPEKPQAPIVMAGKPRDPSGRGRTFIATRKIEPGEVILSSPPHTYPASLSTIFLFCSTCYCEFPSNSKPLRCTVCNVARFCSPECLEFSHTPLLCNALPSLISGDRTLPEDSLFICGDSKWPPDLLFLLCAYSFPPALLLQFISLQNNSTFTPEEDAFVETLHSQLTSLIDPDHIPLHFSPESTSHLLSNKKNHSFPRTLSPTHPQFDVFGDNGNYAYDIYLLLSAVHHECLPNACVFNFFDPKLQNFVKIFRALHAIEEATEISASYLPIGTEYSDRQRILNERHGFICDCMRCETEGLWKEEKDEEPGNGRRNREKKRRKGRRGRGTRAEELEVLKDGGNWYPYSNFLMRHVCDCGGCLAPFPPSDDRAKQNLMECNICGVVRKHNAKHIRKDKHAVAKDVKEDEQAVTDDAIELMSKLLPKMSEKMSKLFLKKLELAEAVAAVDGARFLEGSWADRGEDRQLQSLTVGSMTVPLA